MIRRKTNDETAFVHREEARYVIQYYSQWENVQETESHLQNLREIYKAMRPFVSGESYINYCDLDLQDYAKAYWGTNLQRLKEIKKHVDPANFFKHAQSIPLD